MLVATHHRGLWRRERWLVNFRPAAQRCNPDRFILELLEARVLLSTAPSDVVTYDPGSLSFDWQKPYLFSANKVLDHFTLGTFHGPQELHYLAVTDWGDGTSDSEPIFARADGGFTVVGSHDYTGAADVSGLGAFDITTTVTASDGSSDYTMQTIVTQVNGMAPIEGTEIDPAVGVNTSRNSLFRFVDSDPMPDAEYHAAIDWGDGTTSGGRVVSSNLGTHDVYGDHVYAVAGTFPIHITVMRAGQTLTTSGEADVYDPALADAQLLPGPKYIGLDGTSMKNQVLASFTGALPADQYSATVTWGDGESGSARIVEGGEGAYDVVASHDFASKDDFNLQIQIYAKSLPDPVVYNGLHLLTQAEPLQLVKPAGFRTYKSAVPQPFTVASFFDRTALGEDEDSDVAYTVTIDWGDGTTSSGEALNRGFGLIDVEATRAFPTPGSYGLRVLVTRGDETFRAKGRIQVLDATTTTDFSDNPVPALNDGGPPTAKAFAPAKPASASIAPLGIDVTTIVQQVFKTDHFRNGLDDGPVDPLA